MQATVQIMLKESSNIFTSVMKIKTEYEFNILSFLWANCRTWMCQNKDINGFTHTVAVPSTRL